MVVLHRTPFVPGIVLRFSVPGWRVSERGTRQSGLWLWRLEFLVADANPLSVLTRDVRERRLWAARSIVRLAQQPFPRLNPTQHCVENEAANRSALGFRGASNFLGFLVGASHEENTVLRPYSKNSHSMQEASVGVGHQPCQNRKWAAGLPRLYWSTKS